MFDVLDTNGAHAYVYIHVAKDSYRLTLAMYSFLILPRCKIDKDE